MRVERVHHVEQARIRRRLLGQVVRAAAAQDEHVDIARMRGEVIGRVHGNALGQRLQLRRVAAREQRRQLQIVVLTAGQLNAPAKVAVSQYADARFRHVLLLTDASVRVATIIHEYHPPRQRTPINSKKAPSH